MPGFDDAVQNISKILNPQETAQADTETDTSNEVEETAQADPEPERYEIGDEKVTFEEMKLGYMRNKDYESKMQGSRKLRESLEAQTNEFSEILKDAKKLIEFELKDLESDEAIELKEVDPEEYWKRVDAVKTKAEKFKKLKEKEQKTLEAKKQERLKQEAERLQEAIPDWLDPEKKSAEERLVVEMLYKLGYSDDEISSMTDHRSLVMARKAALFDKIQSQDLRKKEIKEPPTVSTPGTSQKEVPKSETAKDYRSNPSRDSLAAVIRDIKSGKRYR